MGLRWVRFRLLAISIFTDALCSIRDLERELQAISPSYSESFIVRCLSEPDAPRFYKRLDLAYPRYYSGVYGL